MVLVDGWPQPIKYVVIMRLGWFLSLVMLGRCFKIQIINSWEFEIDIIFVLPFWWNSYMMKAFDCKVTIQLKDKISLLLNLYYLGGHDILLEVALGLCKKKLTNCRLVMTQFTANIIERFGQYRVVCWN